MWETLQTPRAEKGEKEEEALRSTRVYHTPLQPMEEMMVEQISIVQPVEDPMPELVDTSRRICGLWRSHGEGLSWSSAVYGRTHTRRRGEMGERVAERSCYGLIPPLLPGSLGAGKTGGRVGSEEVKLSLERMFRWREGILGFVFVSHHSTLSLIPNKWN